MKSDTFYGDFMVKLSWTLSGIFVEKTCQVKLPDERHINLTTKSLSMLSPYYLQVYIPQKAWYHRAYIDTNSSIDFEKLH